MWHGFTEEVSSSWPVRDFVRPAGITDANVDAWSGGRPGPFTTETYKEVFIEGTVPPEDTTKVGMQVVQGPDGNYLLWVDGCAGTPETKGFLVLDNADAGHPDWQAANQDWIARARQGPGTPGGPDPVVKTRTSYIFNNRTTPFGKSWGAPFPPTESCTSAPLESPSPTPELSPSLEPSLEPSPTPEITPEPPTEAPTAPPPTAPPPTPTPTSAPTPTPTPTPTGPPPTAPPPTLEPTPAGSVLP